ncbi:uncharacterized protein RJT20DRAFT_126265 [Scheffersomyces xylosifermentans]|uniref:uncharacterized protein n=1 Tax=Scheffersomyces xylosifermentans TaxID=1304137 RepID=UPI00315C6332
MKTKMQNNKPNTRYHSIRAKKLVKREFFDQLGDSPFGTTLNLGVDPEFHEAAIGHHMAPIGEYTEQDLLANTLYIFLLLVFGTAVLGAISFGLREYYLSFKNKADSATSARIRKINWEQPITSPKEHNSSGNTSNETKVEEASNSYLNRINCEAARPTGTELVQDGSQQKHRNFLQNELQSELTKPLTSGFTHFTETDRSSKAADVFLQGSLKERSKSLESVLKLENIQIFHDEINSPDFNDILMVPFKNTEDEAVESTKQSKASKLTYSFQALHQIREDSMKEFKLLETARKSSIKMSELLRFTSEIPQVDFDSAWQANKAINEARSIISKTTNPDDDASTRAVYTFQLLSIGATYDVFTNPNYYLPAFNDFMESILDTGEVFEILEYCPGYSQLLLIEMILIYCWSHWNFRSMDTTTIEEKFKTWKLMEPVVRSRDTVFRYICNLELGVSTNLGINDSTQMEAEFRVQVFLRDFVKKCYCHDYIQFIPMLAQAVDLADHQKVKFLFYDVLLVLIQEHCNCCMGDYLVENNTDLKALVQHGIWHKHEEKLNRKAKAICQFLLDEGYTQIEAWRDEVAGGKIYVASATMPASPTLQQSSGMVYTTALQRPVTPGGLWNLGFSTQDTRTASHAPGKGSRNRPVGVQRTPSLRMPFQG